MMHTRKMVWHKGYVHLFQLMGHSTFNWGNAIGNTFSFVAR